MKKNHYLFGNIFQCWWMVFYCK